MGHFDFGRKRVIYDDYYSVSIREKHAATFHDSRIAIPTIKHILD